MPRKYKIVILEGDGIAWDIVPECIKILRTAQDVVPGLELEVLKFPCGGKYWLDTGKKEEWPTEAWPTCKEADGIIKGPVGWPGAIYPDGTEAGEILLRCLRWELDTYANIRPCKLYPGVDSPLASKTPGDIDFIIVRENTEDLYQGIGGTLNRGGVTEMAIDVRVVTRKGSERVIRYAFELSKKRAKGAPEDKKKRVTCIDKSNVLRGCMFFREIYNKIAEEYPDIERDYAYIDAWTQWVIRRPEYYDVCVTTNMFGDISSDLACAIQGSLGLGASACIGDKYAYFEPIHGSAPKYAGKNIVNPASSILCGKMMLEWLADKHHDQAAAIAADKIEKAFIAVLKEKRVRTYDLGGTSSTKEMGDAVAEKIKDMLNN